MRTSGAAGGPSDVQGVRDKYFLEPSDLSTFKGEVDTCRHDVEKALEGVSLARRGIKSLREMVNTNTTKDEALLQELQTKCQAAESRLKTEKAIRALLAKDKESLLKSVGGNAEAFGRALKSLHNSGLLSPNVISTMKTKIDRLEEQNEELRQERRAAERERDEALRDKEKVEDARKVDQDKAVREVVRLQGELEECKSEATAVRDHLKEREISFREALAASSAATAAMQISLNECKTDEEAAQQELKRLTSTATAASEARATAEALANERQDRIAQLTVDLDRAHKELDKLKRAGARSSDMTAKYNEMEQKLATSENTNLDLQREIEKLATDMEMQGLTHAAELAERDEQWEAMAPGLSLEDFKARLDRNQLTDDEKAIVKHIEADWEKRNCELDNKIHQLQQQLKQRKTADNTKDGPTPTRPASTASAGNGVMPNMSLPGQAKESTAQSHPSSAASIGNAKTSKKGKPKAVVYGGKRKRVAGTPQETIDGFSDDEVETRKVETKKARVVVPLKRGKGKKPPKPEPEPEPEETLSDFALGSLSPAPPSAPSAPHEAPPPSQYPRHKGTRTRY